MGIFFYFLRNLAGRCEFYIAKPINKTKFRLNFQKSHFRQSPALVHGGSYGIVPLHGLTCCVDNILALQKRSSSLGDSHGAADGAVSHLMVGMASFIAI